MSLIDSRLNVFIDDGDAWAIVAERLGYSPRGGRLELEIFYFGNCLQNLSDENGKPNNYYIVTPIEWESFLETMDNETIKPDASYWLVRGNKVPLCHDKQEYAAAGITLREFEPGEIAIEEVGRLLIFNQSHLFRATDIELYRSIPQPMQKLLVVDEWYHRDFMEMNTPVLSDEQIWMSYEISKMNVCENQIPAFGEFVKMARQQELANAAFDEKQRTRCAPGNYETWQMLAKVITTKDISFYKPTLPANSHWTHWPDAGSM